MKHFLLILVCITGVLTLSAQPAFSKLKLSPTAPKQNSQFTFEYDKSNTPLESQANIDITVYQFNSEGYKVTEPVVSQKGNLYTGIVQLDPNTIFIAFGFSAADEKDLNGNKGYLIPVFNDKNIPVQGYYAAAANFQNIYGQVLLGMPVNAAEGLQILKEGLKQYP